MSALSVVLAEARKETLRRAADPWALIGWLGVPLVIGSLVTAVAGDGTPPRAHLLVVDRDGSLVSSLVVGALETERLAEVVWVETVGEEDGRERIAAGGASALLFLPEGFGRSFLRAEPVRLELITNPSQRILPRIVEELVSSLAQGGTVLQRLVGEELRTFSGEGAPTREGVAAAAATLRGKLGEIAPLFAAGNLEPEVIRATAEGGGASFGLLLFPGIALMAAFFTAQGLAEELWSEREAGTLRRLASAPGGEGTSLAGRSLAAAGALFVVGTGVLAAGFAYHDLPVERFGPALLLLTLAGIVLYLLVAFLQLVAPSRRGAVLLGQMVLFPLLMLGGSFFPSEALPGVVSSVGRWTPNGFATEALKSLLLGGGSGSAAVAVGVLVASAVVLFTLDRHLLASFLRS